MTEYDKKINSLLKEISILQKNIEVLSSEDRGKFGDSIITNHLYTMMEKIGVIRYPKWEFSLKLKTSPWKITKNGVLFIVSISLINFYQLTTFEKERELQKAACMFSTFMKYPRREHEGQRKALYESLCRKHHI